ncbi:MAG: primosomal protein N' [Alphaproteobacteria bacterium]|nr:primosomal protein N' [Alphaproteobacteria bacterium]
MQQNQLYASLLFPRPFSALYTYVIPERMPNLQQGDFVLAPLGRGQEIGIVWTINDQKPNFPNLKNLIQHFPLPPFSSAMQKLIDWGADYYFFPKGLVLKLALPTKEAITYAPMDEFYSLKEGIDYGKLTQERQKIIEHLKTHKAQKLNDILEATDVSRAVFKAIYDKGWIEKEEKQHIFLKDIDYEYIPPVLSESQKEASIVLQNQVRDATYQVTLLDGVTGSGKTEVYYEAIATCLEKGKQALILMPEIALTSQWLTRFEKRFGSEPTLWHSGLTPKTRRENWRACLEGKAKIVVGARSALFLPLSKVGLIIIDEEHEPSYKQEEGVKYHARDMAIMRAKFEQCPIVLASATPSLETLYNVNKGRYHHLVLNDRFGGATFPDVKIIDLRQINLPKGFWLSEPLLKEMKLNLERKEQTLLYLNRRGYAPLTLCHKCGYRVKCRQCSTWLVEHRKKQHLVCHYCGYEETIPTICPECQNQHSFMACGPGVERVLEETRKHFPEANISIMSSDHISKWSDIQTLVAKLEAREIDILIGTQMASKGYHFPHLTLVGVIDGDNGIAGGDPRIAERTYQLLHQVGGRAGRADLKGQVMIQTYVPEQPLIQALKKENRHEFVEVELKTREEWGLPPFGRMVTFLFSGRNQNEVIKIAQQFVQAAPIVEGIDVLGPVEAPLQFIKGRYRLRVLLKIKTGLSAQKYLSLWNDGFKMKSSVTIDIDIDPFNFL